MSTAEAKPVSAAEAKSLFDPLASLPALVLAVSGGPDSTALMLLAARWARSGKRKPKVVAVTVDHGLRPESKREALAVKRLARVLGIAHRTLRWTGKKPATGLQEAARLARYRLLAEAARRVGAGAILTAHTSDDQAETVLLRLARGSGITGLGGMQRRTRLTPLFAHPYPRRGEFDRGETGALMLVRPLLDIPKSRLLATLATAKIHFAKDPSNEDPRFTRVRIRKLMPPLAQEGLTAERLRLLAQRLRRADQALEAAVDAAVAGFLPAQGRALVMDAIEFAGLPDEIRLRVLGRMLGSVADGLVALGKLESLKG
ncbi:MAG TPA: tRNA lysidine(34) synthetase TilS, partial [Burkholderiales bacterium]|nr:tRNA lysidine(34) synthetase TilS [Burkholderiales bacterium]